MSALAEEASTQAGPAVVQCGCGAVVLRAPLLGSGLPVLLEREEVVPKMVCPVCRSPKLRDWDVPCWRCHECEATAGKTGDERWAAIRACGNPAHEGQVGVPLDGFGAAIDEDGFALPINLSRLTVDYRRLVGAVTDPSFEGMAIHRAHACRRGSVRAVK